MTLDLHREPRRFLSLQRAVPIQTLLVPSLASLRRAKSRSISPVVSYPYKPPISQVPPFDMLAKYPGGIPRSTANRLIANEKSMVRCSRTDAANSPQGLTERRDLTHPAAAYFSDFTTFELTPPPPACKLLMLDEVTGGVCRASKSMCVGPNPKALIRWRLDRRIDSRRMDKQRGTSYLSAAVQYLAVKSQVACVHVWRYGSGHQQSPLTLTTGGGILGTGS